MLIYCNGDSFAAGVNLGDHIFPEYPGGFTWEELKTRTNDINRFSKIKSEYLQKYVDLSKLLNSVNDVGFYDVPGLGLNQVAGCINHLERTYAFPAELEKLDSSIKVINKAKPGASMAGICNRTLLDLLELKSKGIRVDRVVIQLTSIGRYEVYDAEFPYFIFDRQLGHFNSDNKYINQIAEAVALKYSNYDHTVKFLYSLITLKETVLSITGKLPVLIDSMNGEHTDSLVEYTRPHINITNTKSVEQYDALVEHSMIKTAHQMLMHNLSKQVNRPYAYDGHFRSEVHKLTAVELIKLL